MELLNASQAIRRFGIPRKTFYDLIEARKIHAHVRPFYKTPGYDPAEIEALQQEMASHQQTHRRIES